MFYKTFPDRICCKFNITDPFLAKMKALQMKFQCVCTLQQVSFLVIIGSFYKSDADIRANLEPCMNLDSVDKFCQECLIN